jgi:hypothetical protein
MIRFGWPVCLLAVAAGFVHRSLHPTPDSPRQPVLTYGFVPALAYLLIGFVIVALTPHGLTPSNW